MGVSPDLYEMGVRTGANALRLIETWRCADRHGDNADNENCGHGAILYKDVAAKPVTFMENLRHRSHQDSRVFVGQWIAGLSQLLTVDR